MKWRITLLAVFLAATGFAFFECQKRGYVAVAEEWFLDFLVANSRNSFEEKLPETSSDVVLVEFQEAMKDEFAAWPPPPLDWLMVLKRIAAHDPEVVAIVEPLRWQNMDPQVVSQVQKSLLQFPTVVMGFKLANDSQGMAQEEGDFASNEMPALTRIDQEEHAIRFTRITEIPDRILRLAGQTGFTSIDGVELPANVIPFAASDGRKVVPSFAAQCVTLFKKKPFSALRMRFGIGASLSLGGDMVVPLRGAGVMSLQQKPTVPSVDALELMVPDVGDDIAREVTQSLGKNKVIVLALIDAQGGGIGKAEAQAIAQALAMPGIKRVDKKADWTFAGIALLLCLIFQTRFERSRVFVFGIGMVVVGTASSLVAFHSSLLWWSPLLATALIIASTFFCFIWPHRKPTTTEAAATPQTV